MRKPKRRTSWFFIALMMPGLIGAHCGGVWAEGGEGDGAVTSQVEPSATLVERQIPGREARPTSFPPFVYESVPPIESSASDFVPTPDRWRQFYAGEWYDPYNQNVLKGDIPIFGEGDHLWFVELAAISDSLLESRRIPVPIGAPSSTHDSGSINTFGDGRQRIFLQNVLFSVSLIKGNTAFKPPDLEFRITPVFQMNDVNGHETGVLRADPRRGDERYDDAMGFQELFVDAHLANLTDRYDFISSRIGIQRFLSDFRGFVYAADEPGVRLFGNYGNNRYQYNLAWFSRLDKDTNTGLNSRFDRRHEDVVIANLYRQDTFALGHTVQASVIHRDDRAGSEGLYYDDNGFLVRPAAIGDGRTKNLSTTYFGLAGDGHFDRINSTAAMYFVTGSESHNQIAQRGTDICAGMAALEVSYDIDWIRLRASGMWASGDSDPTDGRATGFDAIFDNPNFAGGELGYWQRQGIPFIGGGGVNLVNGRSLLPNLRPGKEEGQSNFVNPGLRLYNLGVDLELTPTLKLITNASYLQFDQIESLELLRQDGSLSRNIGFDLSAGLLYRPFLNNNVQVRLGAATLVPDDGVKDLFGDDRLYDVFSNLTLQY